MKKPTFFIVGHSKSGTTALYAFLKQHPSIFMCEPKEPNYFAKDFCRDPRPESAFYPMDETDYLSLFEDAKENQVAGEASACYLYSQVAAREIYTSNPDAKIIMMLREPVDFLYSYHLQALRNPFSEVVKDFQKAVSLESERKHGKKIPKDCSVPELLYYTERIKYAAQVERFYQHFNKNQVKIIIYDDWKKDNQKTYREVLEFLGISADFEPDFKIHNKGGVTVKYKWVQQLTYDISHGKGYWKNLSSLVKTVSPKSLRKLIVSWLYQRFAFSKATPINTDFKTELKQHFKQEVIAISQLINRDLVTLWDYNKVTEK